MKLRDVVIRFGERCLSAPEIDEVNSHVVYVNIRNKKNNVFLADNSPPSTEQRTRSRNSIGYAAARAVSFRRADGPIEDPRRLDRIGPFCGAVERPVLSVLSTFGHASMMSTGIA